MPTLTVKIAAGGTTIDSNGSSLAGHMWLAILCLLLMTLSGCAVLNPTVPIEIPIDLSKAGRVAEAEFWIPADDRIKLTLYFFTNNQRVDGKRLSEIVGNGDNMGTTIPLKVQIVKKNNPDKDRVMLEKEYATTGRLVGFGSNYLFRIIDYLSIESGSYILRVQNIQAEVSQKLIRPPCVATQPPENFSWVCRVWGKPYQNHH